MSQTSPFRPARAALAALCLSVIAPVMAAVDSGSTGADGALNPSVNTEIQLPPSGILNYTSINIPAGVTVRFKKNALNTPVYLLVQGNVTIAGQINVSAIDAKHSGTYGDGNIADDGMPGIGGPGGFDGGRGGRADQAATPAIIRGGAGLGPGGGLGGTEYPDDSNCPTGRYYPRYGSGGSYAVRIAGYSSESQCSTKPNFVFAAAYGSSSLQPLIGGSGGGGGRGGSNFSGAGGGAGGGAILVAASGAINLTSTGSIVANGSHSGGVTGVGGGHWGAGGSGGAIRLLASSVTGAGTLQANGGCSYADYTYPRYCDTNQLGGSPGRITVEAEATNYSGTASPTYVASRPQVVFVNNIPSLRIASIGGTAVPATPTGTADVTFPASQTTPVSVVFETANVPTGNTVTLRVVPAYGTYTEAISPAITGSNSSGSTSVSVALPQGPSTLQAVTSYTITIAMGENLSRFAQNERVEKVELMAALGQTTQTVRLITVSGKRYEVPASILQIAGGNG